ncbi:MAG: phosphotransferase family protein [Deltaproteobacteria bacterium]|nr:phosphotransferase family protein [Deltaproteobacteria bacterium]MBW2418831.1 phosphotransferase family protein [Deltaproteobacteria bacterium]
MSTPDDENDLAEIVPEELTKSTRDPAALRGAVEAWLAGQLPAGAAPEISEVTSPSATGMSSETLLFDARWREAGKEQGGAFVLRLEPDLEDCPVFPVYDMKSQFEIMKLVGERSRVPVPRARWLELDRGPLGAPFFVMDKVEGRVPPDIMPYTFGSWLSEATPEECRHFQDASVGVLAELHTIDATSKDLAFLEFDLPGDTPLKRHFENQRRLYAWTQEDRHHPVIEQAFEWLESHWPEKEGAAVVSWGDARIGNILYAGFEPAAVLDWEMAALGPRELDLGWMIFMHCFYEELARSMDKPGMPDFMRPEDAAATYEAKTGYSPQDLDFYQVYAALRHGIILTRIHARRVHFGEGEWPEDIDSVIYHRSTLERMLDGSWWE